MNILNGKSMDWISGAGDFTLSRSGEDFNLEFFVNFFQTGGFEEDKNCKVQVKTKDK